MVSSTRTLDPLAVFVAGVIVATGQRRSTSRDMLRTPNMPHLCQEDPAESSACAPISEVTQGPQTLPRISEARHGAASTSPGVSAS